MRSILRISSLLVVTALGAVLAGCLDGGGDKNEKSSIRLLNVSTGYESVDLYSNNDNDDGDSDVAQIQGVATGTVSSYVELDSDTYSLKFRRNGVSSTLSTVSGVNLPDDSHITYISFGRNGRFAVTSVSDDETEPDGGKTYVRVVNTSEAGAVDVYLTDETVNLDDAEPIVSSVASGSVGTASAVDAGTYRLRVTAAGDTEDIRFDVSNIAFASQAVVSIILTATPSGALVNALILPQGGELTTYLNTKARVRGAQGISVGTAVTVTVGGVRILGTQPVGAIGSRYEQVEAGDVAVTLGVDGVPVSAPTRTLTAGTDYTLLVWTDGGATTTSLITDDNNVPSSSSRAKIRVLNGMSALGGPVNLSVDFSPVAEGIALGTASTPTEITSGTDFQFDVQNALTAQPLRTQTGITLSSGSVYTYFVSGGTGAANGTLRKDR